MYKRKVENIGYKILSGLNSPWDGLTHYGKRQRWARDYRLEREDMIYYLKKGTVALLQQNSDGLEKIIWILKDGCILGEVPFFYSHIIESYCVCLTDSIVYSFPKNALASIYGKHPEAYTNLMESMAHKIGILVNHLASISLDNASVRLGKYLAQRIVPGSDPPCAVIDLARQNLANYLGINRSSLYKLIRNLEETGILRLEGSRKIVITNPPLFYKLLN